MKTAKLWFWGILAAVTFTSGVCNLYVGIMAGEYSTFRQALSILSYSDGDGENPFARNGSGYITGK